MTLNNANEEEPSNKLQFTHALGQMQTSTKVKKKERRVDAQALRAEERRIKLR